MNNPLVSVIIVHYYDSTRENYFYDCIDGLKKQSFKNFELILVCDNTTSLPNNYIKTIKDIKYKTNCSNRKRGAAWCRKIGVELSNGQYITFIDDDAIPEYNWLKHFVFHMQNSNHVAVGGKTMSTSPTTLIQKFADLDKSQRKPLQKSNGQIFNISTVNACFRKTALLKTGVINDCYIKFAQKGKFYWFEDYDITYRIIHHYGSDKIGYLSSSIVKHYHRNTLINAFKQFMGYGKGAAFWLWSYNKDVNELNGDQNLPHNLTNLLLQIYEIIKSINYYKNHYIRARINNKSIIFSLSYSIYGWLLRSAFHLGTYLGGKELQKEHPCSFCND